MEKKKEKRMGGGGGGGRGKRASLWVFLHIYLSIIQYRYSRNDKSRAVAPVAEHARPSGCGAGVEESGPTGSGPACDAERRACRGW